MSWTGNRSLLGMVAFLGLAAALAWLAARDPRELDGAFVEESVELELAPAARESGGRREGATPLREQEASPPEVEGTEPSGARAAAAARVRFLDEHLAPVARVELRVAEDPSALALSGSDGVALLALDRTLFAGSPRTLMFEARRDGFARERREASATPKKELLLGDWRLVSGGSAEGQVVGPDGSGLARVQVACLRDGFSAQEWELARRGALEALWRPGARATSEPDGSFRLDEVPAGRIRLVAVADDRPAARSDLIDAPAGGLARGVRIGMEEGDGGTTIAGIVLDPQGHPVPGAHIDVRCSRAQFGLSAGPDGRFRVRCDDKKPSDVSAFDPEQRYREATRLGVIPGATDLELRLQVAPEVELFVRSREGAPIERFAVAVIAERTAQPLAFFREAEHPLGVFVLGAPAQDFLVEVRANGWLPARLGPFSAGAPPRELDCRLAPASGVRGRVTAGAMPVGGAHVALHEAARKNDTYNGFPLRMQREPATAAETGAGGEFSLSVEQEGSYYLRVEAEGYALAERGPLALSPDADHEEHVQLDQGGALAVRVRSAKGASVAGALVAISRGDGLARTERTDETGALEFPRLTPGPWQVVLSEEEIDPDEGATYFGTKAAGEIPSNCRVFAGEVTRVDLWLEEQGESQCQITGRLTIDGRPAEGWLAALDRERAVVLAGQPFLEPGLFRLGVDEPGSYRLRLSTDATDPGAMLVLLDLVELYEVERYWSLDLTTGALEGTLAGSADAPVFHRWKRDRLESFAPLVPLADGRFRCARVPAGRGSLVRIDQGRPLEEQTPVVLRELVVEAGKTTSVEL